MEQGSGVYRQENLHGGEESSTRSKKGPQHKDDPELNDLQWMVRERRDETGA
jgi:hypothetical protein